MVHHAPPPACGNCPIRHNAVCSECDADAMVVLERVKSYRVWPAGSRLASAGEPLEHFSSIVTGCATMSRTLEDGRRQTVGLLLPSDYIGRPGRRTSAYDVEAVTDVKLCRFERQTFERLVRDTPQIAARLLTMTLDELDAARDWAVVLGRLTARERVAAFLLSLARRDAASRGLAEPLAGTKLRLPLSREAIGDHLGPTIETTSRQFTRLRKEGVIAPTSTRDVVIPSLARLAAAASAET